MLTADAVDAAMMACLVEQPRRNDPDQIEVEALRHTFAFSRTALERHRTAIEAMLSELRLEFFDREYGGGDGGTFLDLCETGEGRLWTSRQDTVEALVALGIGLGRVNILVPRQMWAGLPGGMPYLIITGIRPARSAAA